MNSRLLLNFTAAAGLGFGLLWLRQASAATVTLQPVADASLLSAFPNNNFGDGRTFNTGGRPRGGVARALIRFDIADNLPAGAIVNSVSLRLTVVNTPPSGSVDSFFDLHRLTASWAEGSGADRGGSPAGPNEVTWLDRFGASGFPWTTPGGDSLSGVSASTDILGNGRYTFNSTPALIADVQGWLNKPANNFGWLLESEAEAVPGTIRRFGSHEDPANAPLLTIQYTLVPEPSACALLVLGLAALVWRRYAH